jgi:hypothetical protein
MLVAISGLVFGLIESLLVYRPEGVIFNLKPLTVTEYILDIVGYAIFFYGMCLQMYDINLDEKQKIKDGLFEAIEESGYDIEIK